MERHHMLMVFIVVASLLGTVAGAEETPVLVPETVLVNGATVALGTPLARGEANYHEDESPVSVNIKSFRIGKYPVTADQLCQFLNSPEAVEEQQATLYFADNLSAVGTGEKLSLSVIEFRDGMFVPREGAERMPANLVTWKGAILYCQWLTQETGLFFRLPSEAEWELAARGGVRPWPWGDVPPSSAHGPRYSASRLVRTDWRTSLVGTHPENATPEGVCDMLAFLIGEWCSNKYAGPMDADSVADNAADLADLSTPRVVRGCLDREQSKRSLLSRISMSGGRHLGRPWTRSSAHPMSAVQHAARYGFRVVLVTEREEPTGGEIGRR